MKKGQQLLAIAGLFVATIIVLGMSFSKNYEKDGADDILIKIEDTELLETDAISTETDEISTETKAEEVQSPWEFVTSDISYFDDALFIGDSRAAGIKDYSNLKNMDYFATVGMSVYNLWKTEMEMGELGTIGIEELLHTKSYGKIYIMLGLNEIGYNLDNVAKKYQELLDFVHEAQPDAIIYICSNLHVTKKRSLESDVENNTNIDILNEKLSLLADEETYFWLDVNEKFDDAEGSLTQEYTGDNVHLYAKYYQEWADWLCQKTVKINN